MSGYLYSQKNKFAEFEQVSLEEYLTEYSSAIIQNSERLFLSDFLYPLLGPKNIKYVVPQYPFIDSEGRTRRIDFAFVNDNCKIALEVNGETYHAEGIIPNEVFDDNLQRQNEILTAGWELLRFSYNQLQDEKYRERIFHQLNIIFSKNNYQNLVEIKPNRIQEVGLDALKIHRESGEKKGLIILPTGTGKTYLSAFDSKTCANKVLFVVHRLDILSQAKNAFEKIWSDSKLGILTGDIKENIYDSDVLFASKDTLKNPDILESFREDYFDYVIIDEVHHGQAPSYKSIFEYFKPNKYFLGMTATPDRADRKDILELFDYKKVFEYSLNDAIELGFLVPYTYYGLKDNIDYSNIRYNGVKYNVQDLEHTLIINERNEQILKEYLEKGNANKALGFCCSIKHANKMAEFFNNRGIPAVSITSETENREEIINKFRNNKYNIAFTVDLFNEGIDFPNLRVLLFLRPTESKTVFIQQLGRGLRLCSGKDRVIILDFIGNYKKANAIRQLLSKNKKAIVSNTSGRIEKFEYEYAPNCEVYFDSDVETLLDNQDKEERDITKEDLIDAYYKVADLIKKKPSQEDIKKYGEYPIAKYINLFGSWYKFLREIGEITEASYHFPQGVHLGHILFVLKTLLNGDRENTILDDKYIRMRGELSSGREGAFQRQTKYKLQALMELGLIDDDRKYGLDEQYTLKLSIKGREIAKILKPLLDTIDLSFKSREEITWDMNTSTSQFNDLLKEYLNKNRSVKNRVFSLFMEMPAVYLMLNYIYRYERKINISKNDICSRFFKTPTMEIYCDRLGIEPATDEGAKHRCPFLLNILDALDIIEQTRSDIKIKKFIVTDKTFKINDDETTFDVISKIKKFEKYISDGKNEFSENEIVSLKETFGKEFLTKDYVYNTFEIINIED